MPRHSRRSHRHRQRGWLLAAAGRRSAQRRPRASRRARRRRVPDTYLRPARRRDALCRRAGRAPRARCRLGAGALAQARFVPGVPRFIMPPPAGTAKNWAAYRARFVEPMRIRAGVAFWRDNESGWRSPRSATACRPRSSSASSASRRSTAGTWATSASRRAGHAGVRLPGRAQRPQRLLPRRTRELVRAVQARGHRPARLAGLLRRRDGHAAVHAVSINRYAVDFDGDGRVDLHANAADVIGSVAHYLAEFGWRRGMPTHYAVEPPTETTRARRCCWRPTSCRASPPPRWRRAAPRCRRSGRADDGLLALVELQNGDGRAELRRWHAELLRTDALQLVELLRDGGDRAGRGGARGARTALLRRT